MQVEFLLHKAVRRENEATVKEMRVASLNRVYASASQVSRLSKTPAINYIHRWKGIRNTWTGVWGAAC